MIKTSANIRYFPNILVTLDLGPLHNDLQTTAETENGLQCLALNSRSRISRKASYQIPPSLGLFS